MIGRVIGRLYWIGKEPEYKAVHGELIESWGYNEILVWVGRLLHVWSMCTLTVAPRPCCVNGRSHAGQLGVAYINSLSHERCVCNLKLAIFKLMSMINIFGVSFKVNAPRPHWWLVNVDSGNGLVPSGNSHYLSQCWPRSMSPHGVTTPQWVNGFYFRSFVSRLPGRYMHTMMTVPGRSLVTSQVQLSRHE